MGQFKPSRSNISYDIVIAKTADEINFGTTGTQDYNGVSTMAGTRRGSIEVTLEIEVHASATNPAGNLSIVVVADQILATDVIMASCCAPTIDDTLTEKMMIPFVSNVKAGSFWITLVNWTGLGWGGNDDTIVVNWVAL